jgi:hypothetical protein
MEGIPLSRSGTLNTIWTVNVVFTVKIFVPKSQGFRKCRNWNRWLCQPVIVWNQDTPFTYNTIYMLYHQSLLQVRALVKAPCYMIYVTRSQRLFNGIPAYLIVIRIHVRIKTIFFSVWKAEKLVLSLNHFRLIQYYLSDNKAIGSKEIYF